MKKSIIVALSLIFLLACSDEKEDPKPEVLNNDYFPNTSGSKWEFGGTFTATMEVTGIAKTFDGKIYSELKTINDFGTSLSYLFKKNGEYYARSFIQGPGLGSVDLLLLKDNVPQGTTWSQTFAINGVNNNFEYNLLQKDATILIGSKSYTDVIAVQMNQSYSFQGIEFPLSAITWYFSKGIGIVKTTTEYDPITGLDDYNGSTEIQSYTIK